MRHFTWPGRRYHVVGCAYSLTAAVVAVYIKRGMDDSYGDFDDRVFAQVETCVCGQGNDQQATALESAVEKLVAAAGQVGLTVDDLIRFLRSGMSVGDLLDYVGSKTHQRLQ